MYEIVLTFGTNFSLCFKSFNTPELARDFLLNFSRYNETYVRSQLHNIETDEWFDFDKYGNIEPQTHMKLPMFAFFNSFFKKS